MSFSDSLAGFAFGQQCDGHGAGAFAGDIIGRGGGEGLRRTIATHSASRYVLCYAVLLHPSARRGTCLVCDFESSTGAAFIWFRRAWLLIYLQCGYP